MKNLEMREATAKRPAVFFDRDGTLMEEVHYCRDPQKVRVIPGTTPALRRLREAGYFRFIVTNQSGLARGLIAPMEYEAVQAELLRQIENEIDGVFMCADHPDVPSHRRKPGTGMLEEATLAWPVDMENSWFVGDKAADIFCGRNGGLRTFLVRTGYGTQVGPEVEAAADGIAGTAAEAVELILASESQAKGVTNLPGDCLASLCRRHG